MHNFPKQAENKQKAIKLVAGGRGEHTREGQEICKAGPSISIVFQDELVLQTTLSDSCFFGQNFNG